MVPNPINVASACHVHSLEVSEMGKASHGERLLARNQRHPSAALQKHLILVGPAIQRRLPKRSSTERKIK